MHIAFGGEDVDLLPIEKALIGDSHDLWDATGCAVPALVAQDAGDVVVMPHGEPEEVLRDPVVGREGGLRSHAARGAAIFKQQRRKIQLVDQCGHQR